MIEFLVKNGADVGVKNKVCVLNISFRQHVLLFIEYFPQICSEGKWLQNRLRADKNESRSFLAADTRDTNVEVSALSPNTCCEVLCLWSTLTPVSVDIKLNCQWQLLAVGLISSGQAVT